MTENKADLDPVGSIEEPKICPLYGFITEEGRLRPVPCYKTKCAIWDTNRAQCGFKTYVRIFGNMGR